MSLRAIVVCVFAYLWSPSILRAEPVMQGETERPLRYTPERTDFVIENGSEFFNRPLYGTNTPFRVDGGDKPEFSLYLPGRGGNLRLGLLRGDHAKWLSEAQHIVTRYRPGSMVYEIQDPIIGSATLRLTALPLATGEGLILQASVEGDPTSVKLIFAFGGVNGEKGRRNGDIGTERLPVGEFFQFKPEDGKDDRIEISGSGFVVHGKPGSIGGTASGDSRYFQASAEMWQNATGLLSSRGTTEGLKVVAGEVSMSNEKPVFMCLQRMDDQGALPDDLNAAFHAADKRRQEIAGKLAVETPDPFVNAAAAALCVAADGVWDEPAKAFMHGAVAWRNKLLGWRGAYGGDALGWNDRTRQHLTYWAGRQKTGDIPDTIPTAEPEGNLSRNENALHSNGDMSGTHYDMNLVYMDALFRHLLWTGDLEFAREMWPVIERHLAWERRLFRRPFGPEKLPLYEAYACIWASDDLWYNGGGATHSSSYNFFHNAMAAELARSLGKDATSYEEEAGLISRAIQMELWLPRQGWFAESKDLLGLGLVRPNPGLWTLYHALDSKVPDAREAWQMTRFIDTRIAHIPIHGPGVPEGGYFTLPTTNWMPYAWSTNNVVMAEAAHTSLAYWQAARPDEAFKLFKGCVLDSMFMGLCPGNVGMCTSFDMARGETQRDFADGVGAGSRALVEGLFGVRPDALAGELLIRPGFPREWNSTKFHHTSLDYTFRREGLREMWTVESRFPKAMKLRLEVPALRDQISKVTCNGQLVKWSALPDSVGQPWIVINAPAVSRSEVTIEWRGAELRSPDDLGVIAEEGEIHAEFGAADLLDLSDDQGALSEVKRETHSFKAKVTGEEGHRTVFGHVKQGDFTWWQPVEFEIRPLLEVLQDQRQDDHSLKFRVRNNAVYPLQGSVAGHPFTAPAKGISDEIKLSGTSLISGTNRILITTHEKSFERTVTNWNLQASQNSQWESLDITPYLNDRVTQIFKNEYISPRSPFCSLAMPTQGYGSWCHPKDTFQVDDIGIRTVAAETGGHVLLPQGIPLQTTGTSDGRNIAFTSQWSNYPQEIAIPLKGKARQVYLLMAGSTNSMTSHFDNGEVVVTYTDKSCERLALRNPTNWWPIDQDYVIDDFAFKRPEPVPPRIDLKTGKVRMTTDASPKRSNLTIPGGAATVLDLPLDPQKELESLTIRTLANEIVIGLMSATLDRNSSYGSN